jgi:transcriptional activator FlhC
LEQDEKTKPARPRSRRSRNTPIRNFDDVRVIRRLAALGARIQAIRMTVGGPWTHATIAMVTRHYLGRVDPPGRRPTALAFANSHRDRVHWTLAYLVHEIAKCWPRSVPDILADSYELYAFMARHISETRIAIESCVPFTGDTKLMGMQLAQCRECSGPRLIASHQLRSQFVCDGCSSMKARRTAVTA